MFTLYMAVRFRVYLCTLAHCTSLLSCKMHM